MSYLHWRGKRIPALAVAIALPVLGALYALDAFYFGFTDLGYRETVAQGFAEIDVATERVPELQREVRELDARNVQIQAIRDQIKALEKSVAALKQRVR